MRPWSNATAAAVKWKFSPAGIVHPVPIRLSNGRSATATWPRMSVRPPSRRVPKSIRSRPPNARTRKNKLPVPSQTPLDAWAGFFYVSAAIVDTERPEIERPGSETLDNNFTSTALPRAEKPHDCRWPFSLDIFHVQAVITGAYRNQSVGERSRSNTSDRPNLRHWRRINRITATLSPLFDIGNRSRL